MRIVFSRKGFDSSAGRRPSPIVDGRPVSLPIPTNGRSRTSYADLGIGELVERTTRGRILGSDLCHDDPMFGGDLCWFGQCGAAQGHLERQGVGVGDVFLFFGLFTDPDSGERHHRIFGHMKVMCFGPPKAVMLERAWTQPPRPHPHLEGVWSPNNTLYHGPGATARYATTALRLSAEGGPLNRWVVPSWLRRVGLTYHDRQERWLSDTELDSAKRGQEFICKIDDNKEARRWLEGIFAEMRG